MRTPRVSPSRARFVLYLSLALNILVLVALLLQSNLSLSGQYAPAISGLMSAADGLMARAERQLGWSWLLDEQNAGKFGPPPGVCSMCAMDQELCEDLG
jgi:hypothetical protein